ncbi:MAG: protein-disulfide reductase DsbD family protein [Thermohalobaculum sp.]|nr:protein-disulfide reductase DsbD family protein [Thermohalobaculum sp.]
MKRARLIILATALAAQAAWPLLPGGAGRAAAQALVSSGESFLQADLVLGDRSADGVREAGLRLDIAPGWKTYWRNPGEAGIPPTFDWSRSVNVADIEIDWPRPSSFESFGLRTLGYKHRVVLPLRLHPVDPSAPMALNLRLALGVCDDICILEETSVERAIAPGAAAEDAALLAAARAMVPGPGAGAGLIAATCRLSGAGGDRDFAARLTFDRPLAEPIVVLEGPNDSWFHGTAIVADGGQIDVTSQLSLVDPGAWVERGDLRISVFAGDVSADIRGCSAPAG